MNKWNFYWNFTKGTTARLHVPPWHKILNQCLYNVSEIGCCQLGVHIPLSSFAELSPVHTSCECEVNLTSQPSFRRDIRKWVVFNCCKLFAASLWRQHSYRIRIRRKYEPGFTLMGRSSKKKMHDGLNVIRITNNVHILTGLQSSRWNNCAGEHLARTGCSMSKGTPPTSSRADEVKQKYFVSDVKGSGH